MLSVTLFAVFSLLGFAGAQNTVTFKVNMSYQMRLGRFDGAPDDTVCIRGNTSPLDWGGYVNILEDADNDSIYEITIDFGGATGTVEYKFVFCHNGVDKWEDAISNRTVELTGSPVVLDTVWFNNEEPGGPPVEADVLFQVAMIVQRACGFFDPDSQVLTVRGGTSPLSWGYPGCLPEMQEVIGKPDTFAVVKHFNAPRGTVVQYKYQFSKQPDDGEYGGTWESCHTECIEGNFFFVYDPVEGSQVIPIRYFSETGPEDVLTQAVDVTWQVNVSAVRDSITKNGFWYFPDMVADTLYSIDSVYIAGSVEPLIWVWDHPPYPDTLRMYDDGPEGGHGDLVAGDDIWSCTITFPACYPKNIEHKYGINGEDNEFPSGDNRLTLVDDSSPTFLAPVETFGTFTGIEDQGDDWRLPSGYSLYQNYPNPFNANTAISYHLSAVGGRRSAVSLKIYNILGQEVRTLVNKEQAPGYHSVSWNGRNDRGEEVTSGVYLYRLKAGNYTKAMKMVLLK